MPAPDKPTFEMPVDEGLYVRDGAGYDAGDNYFDEPQERVAEERDEANAQVTAIPFLKEIHAWFDEQIAACDTLDNIQLNSIEVPGGFAVSTKVSVEAQVFGYQLLKQKLIEKKESFPDLELTS